MADKTLYDLLEVADTDSADAIRAAYERLSQEGNLGPVHAHNASEASLRRTALKEAFLTLSDARKRATYDARLLAQRHVPVASTAFTLRNVVLLAVLIVTLGGAYYGYHRSRELAADRALAQAQAREAKDSDAERARLQISQERAKLNELAARQRREADLQRFQSEQTARERENRIALDRERAAQSPTPSNR